MHGSTVPYSYRNRTQNRIIFDVRFLFAVLKPNFLASGFGLGIQNRKFSGACGFENRKHFGVRFSKPQKTQFLQSIKTL
jgi:hypothetical protein